MLFSTSSNLLKINPRYNNKQKDREDKNAMKSIQSNNFDYSTLTDDETLWAYNCFDVCVTMEIFNNLKGNKTYDFARELLGPVTSMMRRGIRVDHERRETLHTEFKEAHVKHVADLNEISNIIWGKDLNPDSPKQLQSFVYDTLGCKKIHSRKKGEVKISLDREAMEKLQLEHPNISRFFELLLDIRDAKKSMDFLKMPLRDGRFFANFKISGTETGRFSSSKDHFGFGSNLQNVTKELRQIFIPDEGMVFIQTDLKGAESVGVAYLSGDDNYINAVNSSDVHTLVSSMVFGIPAERAAADALFYRDMTYRDMAKRAGHGSSYGGKAFTMARHLKLSVKLVQDFQDKFFKAFPLIPRWHTEVQVNLQTKGKLTTPTGRTRIFHGRLDDDSTLREAIAYVPQSLIADVMNAGMLNVFKNLGEAQLLAQVHDAILVQVPEKLLDSTYKKMIECLKVPIPIHGKEMVIPSEGEWGYNWGPVKYDKETKQPKSNLQGLRKI